MNDFTLPQKKAVHKAIISVLRSEEIGAFDKHEIKALRNAEDRLRWDIALSDDEIALASRRAQRLMKRL